MTLDKLSLDAMVQGRNTNTENWKELIKEPERERVWSEAVKRRENLDRFCYFAAKWPQFVSYYQKAKQFVKRSTNPPQVFIMNEQNILGDLSLALSESDSSVVPSLVNVKWGSQQLIEIQGEQVVSFNTETQVQIHYRYMDSEGWITSNDKWEFTPNEGAVMLTFIDGDVKTNELPECLKSAKSVGYAVLLPSFK
ncbi:hypothetical protein G5C64_19155 [Vibrio diabolicus]|uniref:hypothetical protein n=1 Tax=Vibrio diabolicus TaxID=50719 RepID=UPI0021517C42|nr:hypothetical protein [Vibrio diabolicus]MCE3220934.1 hypothetical protein [Vibrio diabolicus]